MGLIITSIIITILLIGVLGIDFREGEWNVRPRMLFGLFGLSIILFGCFSIIGANNVGIMYNLFKNGIQNEILNEGFRLKSPFDTVYEITTEIQEFTFNDISVQTSDSQWVNSVIQIQARIDKENAFEYFKKIWRKKLERQE